MKALLVVGVLLVSILLVPKDVGARVLYEKPELVVEKSGEQSNSINVTPWITSPKLAICRHASSRHVSPYDNCLPTILQAIEARDTLLA
uniref:Uncharacterized protein n=1 Tax=Nelumbo nucifera TaxID=4432 RepID=A0A822Z435_NELNU|nr:TPA_asm: hypothetical protein HUJ06_013616 [Nelumbo nucifera]